MIQRDWWGLLDYNKLVDITLMLFGKETKFLYSYTDLCLTVVFHSSRLLRYIRALIIVKITNGKLV